MQGEGNGTAYAVVNQNGLSCLLFAENIFPYTNSQFYSWLTSGIVTFPLYIYFPGLMLKTLSYKSLKIHCV